MTQSFACPACGASNQPRAGAAYMACEFCGTNLTIPEPMRTRALPKVEKIPSRPKPVPIPEIDAPDLLRKAQPLAVKAWNLYAYWTWIRWLIPTCLIILVIGLIICAALGLIPFILGSLR